MAKKGKWVICRCSYRVQPKSRGEIKAIKFVIAILSTLALVVMSTLSATATDTPSEVTVFKNVNVFDGKCEQLLKGYGIDVSLRIYVPDLEKFKTWTSPKAERIESR